jgi:hypothetical protein
LFFNNILESQKINIVSLFVFNNIQASFADFFRGIFLVTGATAKLAKPLNFNDMSRGKVFAIPLLTPFISSTSWKAAPLSFAAAHVF